MEQRKQLSLFSKDDRPISGLTSEAGIELVLAFERLVAALEGIREEQRRIADHFNPPPPDVVGTDYVATELDCTKVWVSQMARDGEIPNNCIVPGTGNGKPWKFRRSGIEKWLSGR